MAAVESKGSAFHLLWRDGANSRSLEQGDVAGLASSPIWNTMGRGALVYRSVPEQLLGAVGDFDDADTARLDYLARWLPGALASQRFLDYADVSDAVRDLANQLRSIEGFDANSCDYVAIPRGGIIVLGMLAYALGLSDDVLVDSGDPSRPLVVVDDCSLTGNRFKRFIRNHQARRSIMFAQLCSTPELRTAIVQKERYVTRCVAAIDLSDRAPEKFGDGYEEWLTHTVSRIDSDRYWIGQTEEVAFPWNEPDHNFWNPVTETTEWGWTIVSPDKCFKNRRPVDNPPTPIIEFNPASVKIRIADSVLAAEWNGITHVLDTETGVTFTLEDVAADIWRGLVDGLALEDMVSHVVSNYDVEHDVAREDCIQLVEQLENIGIIERATSGRKF